MAHLKMFLSSYSLAMSNSTLKVASTPLESMQVKKKKFYKVIHELIKFFIYS